MRGSDFDKEAADRLLDGTAQGRVPDGLEPVANLLEDVRLLRAPAPDTALEATTVREMKLAVGEVLAGSSRRWRRRSVPLGIRAAIAFGALALVGAASGAADRPLPGRGVADAVLSTLGISRDDEDDRRADELERRRDEAERRAEAAKLATEAETETAEAGPEKAAANRAAALEFTTAKKAWTRCVAEKARRHEPGSGPFDPVAACGPKPVRRAQADEGDKSGRGKAGRRGPAADAGPSADAGPPAHAGPPPSAEPKTGTSKANGQRKPSSGRTSRTTKRAKKEGRAGAGGRPSHAGPPDG